MKMKMNKLMMAAVAATMLFASCSNEENASNNATGEKAKLIINITNPTTVRSAGAAASGDNSVTNFVAFAFNSNGTLNSPMISFAGNSTTVNTVTTAATMLYVVGNAGAGTPASLGSITTEAALLAVLEDLDAQYTTRWATASGALAFTQSGTNFSATFTQAMTFVSARITLTVDNAMVNYDGTTAGSVILTNVAVLNAVNQSKLFGTSLMPATKLYNAGMGYTGFTNAPAAGSITNEAYLKDTYAAAANYHYYTFENTGITTAANLPTIVTLVGTYNGSAIYYPVHIAPYEQYLAGSGSTANGVERGKSYDINIKLSGDAAPGGGGGGGTVDPTNPVVTASVTVNLSITDWTPVVLNKEFN